MLPVHFSKSWPRMALATALADDSAGIVLPNWRAQSHRQTPNWKDYHEKNHTYGNE
jgi:hypothetical protein